MVKMEEKDVFLGRMFYYLKLRLLDKKNYKPHFQQNRKLKILN